MTVMYGSVKKVVHDSALLDQEKTADKKVGSNVGRTYSCHFNQKRVGGLVALVVAAAVLIFAIVFASGIFGGGEIAFIAGGLTLMSMLGFGLAAYGLGS